MSNKEKSASANSISRESLSAFRERGLTAAERTILQGDGIPAEEVLKKLESKVEAARNRQKAIDILPT